ncbi:MAG: hypothetical protein R6U50_17130 [Desulfobacterales bacterium]
MDPNIAHKNPETFAGTFSTVDERSSLDDLLVSVSRSLSKQGSDIPGKVRRLGSQISRYSLKTAAGMIVCSPGIVDRVGFQGLEKISRIGIGLSRNCWVTAVEMFKNSPGLIDVLMPMGGRKLVLDVYELSERVCPYSWKTAAGMLDSSPSIIRRVGIEGLYAIAEMGIRIAPGCWLTAMGNFEKSPRLIDRLSRYCDKEMIMDVLDLGAAASHTSWQMAVRLMEESPALISRVGFSGLQKMAIFGGKIARHSWLGAVEMIERSTVLIDDILDLGTASLVLEICDTCGRAADVCWRTAVHLFYKSPFLIDRVGTAGFQHVAEKACELAQSNTERAVSFINGESLEGASFMAGISDGIALSEVKPILANYLNALLSYRIEIAGAVGHATDGRKIFLPESVNDFNEKKKNFMMYKIYATHEEAHLEYGSFDFSLSEIRETVDNITARYGKRS